MANTINLKGAVLQITAIDEDWDWADTFDSAQYKNGIKIQSIEFDTEVAGDVCIIKNESDSGPRLFKASGNAVDVKDERCKYFNGTRLKPYLDFSEGVYNAAASVTIIYEL
jgi:hypothetical protein